MNLINILILILPVFGGLHCYMCAGRLILSITSICVSIEVATFDFTQPSYIVNGNNFFILLIFS